MWVGASSTDPRLALEERKDMDITFTTKSGVELELHPISFYDLIDIQMETRKPEVPTYEAEIAGGARQSFPHDETTLKSAEDWATWRAYLEKMRNCEHRENYLVVGFGVRGVTVPNEWKEKRKAVLKNAYFPPGDAEAEWVGYYVCREIAKSPVDVTALVRKIMKISEIIPEEVLDKALESFPDQAQIGESPIESDQNGNGAVDARTIVRDSSHRKGVGDNG